VIKSDLIALFAFPSIASGPILIIVGLLFPSLSTDTSEEPNTDFVQFVFIAIGIAEIVISSLLFVWRYRLVADIFAHGAEVKGRLVSYSRESATAEFEYSVNGQRQKASKRLFGRNAPKVTAIGQEFFLIVNQDKPERFVLRDQYS
jgi:hypothetical protein